MASTFIFARVSFTCFKPLFISEWNLYRYSSLSIGLMKNSSCFSNIGSFFAFFFPFFPCSASPEKEKKKYIIILFSVKGLFFNINRNFLSYSSFLKNLSENHCHHPSFSLSSRRLVLLLECFFNYKLELKIISIFIII